MALPKDVQDAVSRVDRSLREWRICKSPWQTIRAHLLSQDAEIERLQSRLAAANERLEEAEMDAVRYRWLKMSAPAGFQYQLIRTPWTSWDSQIGDGINDMLLANNINARITNE